VPAEKHVQDTATASGRPIRVGVRREIVVRQKGKLPPFFCLTGA
jgi:hypothetical protein